MPDALDSLQMDDPAFADAIELISRKNAEFLGIEKKVGTLTKGRWASFTCWNGDPFDLTTFPVAVFGEGECLHRQQSLSGKNGRSFP